METDLGADDGAEEDPQSCTGFSHTSIFCLNRRRGNEKIGYDFQHELPVCLGTGYLTICCHRLTRLLGTFLILSARTNLETMFAKGP